MEKVVTVNLNGNSFTFEESAYDALRAYLEGAEAALANNPDKTEIVRDLEQAIADKCTAYLSAHKSVVAAGELARVLQEMGPVEGAEAAPETGAAPGAGPVKKLYRVRDPGSVTGVSGGLGAYLHIDPNVVRLGWIIGTALTGGFLLIPYIALVFIMPPASTPEQIAAAHGAPFRAEEVIERAKREYARFANDPPWRGGYWRHRHWRRWRGDPGPGFGWTNTPPSPPANPPSYATRLFAGFFAIVFSLISAALTIAFILAIVSLAATGAVLGFAPPASVPIWLAIIALVIAFAVVSAPFRALRHASYGALNGDPYYYRYHHGGGGLGLVFLLVLGWLAYTHSPDAHFWIDHTFEQMRLWVRSIAT